MPAGQGLYVYQAKDVTVEGFRGINGGSVASEIAASVDVVVRSSAFGVQRSATAPTLARTAPLTLDFGTAFFTVTKNHFCAAGNIGVQILYGVHDGAFTSNYLGPVRAAGISPVGIVGRGAYRVKIADNRLTGGDPGGVAIDFADTSALRVNIKSETNTIGPNSIAGFTTRFAKMSARDTYLTTSPSKEAVAGVADNTVEAVRRACVLNNIAVAP